MILTRSAIVRRLERRARGQRGTSLVEITVVMMLLSIVMVGMIKGFASFQNDAASVDIRLQNLEEARVLMAATAKDLRTATRLDATLAPFNIAGDRELLFYANVNSPLAPELVHIYVDVTSELIETTLVADAGSLPPNYTYTGTPVVRYVGRYVANPPTQPIFTYYDADGVVLPLTPLSVADAAAVVSVGITFAIAKTNGYNVPVTTLVNRVYLPNVYYNPLPSPT